jgi:hypothetical protein
VLAFVCAKKYGPEATISDTYLEKRNLVRSLAFAQQAYDGEDKNRNGVLDPGEDLNNNGILDRYILPAPPSPPRVRVVPDNQKVTVYWDRSAEASVDPISGKKDFEGYRIYRTNAGVDLDPNKVLNSSFILVNEFDRTDDSVFYNTGFNAVALNQPITFDGDTTKYWYKKEITSQLNGWQYVYTVTAFDAGDPANNVESLESSRIQNARRVFPGTMPADAQNVEPRVYPNPYYAEAMWDGPGERLRKIYFYNLPKRAEIRVFTMAGDLVKTMNHDAATYNASDIEWSKRYSNGTQILAGGEHAWDLITDNDQAIATGLYLFTVENLDNGSMKRGKFVIIKYELA